MGHFVITEGSYCEGLVRMDSIRSDFLFTIRKTLCKKECAQVKISIG